MTEHKCPECGSKTGQKDEDGKTRCVSCGEVLPTPANPTDKTTDELVSEVIERHREYERKDPDTDTTDHIVDATQEVLSGHDTVCEHFEFYEYVRDAALQKVD